MDNPYLDRENINILAVPGHESADLKDNNAESNKPNL
ncbi:MAG: hypothetical protein QIT35_gp88 [Methanophagales virus PBV299]|uniref:Uncharacterized protein n=1 Tax=Methanophagales virus PBV299 TaxID=2987730 RepID=A0ABY6GLJ5_9CAUD|nr:MAG: hypothetical protein QIT35_gp88 [Methanophagales virus PBV299]UYL64884.1 MAG: hypothetical protein OFDIEDLO_00088 [Methanophagales virus PBV299]